jgi:putative DNA primase/helicase
MVTYQTQPEAAIGTEAPKPSILSTTDFLREYFRGASGNVFITSYRNNDSEQGRGELRKVITRDPNEVAKFIAERDKPEHENGIYFSTATFKTNAISRSGENCDKFVSLFSDVDDDNRDLSRSIVLDLLENLESPPTLIVDSGHGLQPHWLLSEPVEDAARIEVARKKLQSLTASDGVHDAARVMRLVGTHNSKRGDWFEVRVVSYRPEYRYSLEALEEWLDRQGVIVPRKQEPERVNGAAHNGSSYQYYSGATDVDRIRDALKHIPPDKRDIWLNVGMALHDELRDAGRSLWDQWSSTCKTKYSDRDQEKTWKSFSSDGKSIGIGTLFGLAKQYGWDARLNNNDNTNSQQSNDKADAPHNALQSIRASDVKMSAVTWLWPNRFAIGKLGIIAGLPDEGKGQIFADIAARVTTGDEWPCREGAAPQGNVILLTAEDDPSDTVVPRLAAAGADLSRIVIVKMVRDSNKERMFSLITDLELLRKKIIEVGDVNLVQIDPVTAYMGHGKVDSYRTTDVRAVLGPLTVLAAELKVAVMAIMHFNKKMDVTNALLRISDSLAFGAAARHVYGVINDSENKRKLMVRAKNNLAASNNDKTLAYHFAAREVGKDEENGKPIIAPYILWEPNYVDVTATEAMQAATDNKSPGARDEAKSFLREILANGPVAKKDIEDAAEGHGISRATLFRAKKDLKIKVEKDRTSPTGGWNWRLNPESSTADELAESVLSSTYSSRYSGGEK